MPTYQYACTTCGEQIEMVQRFSDDPLTVCPACGGTLRKVFSPVGIVFKGSGFYRTDSRKAAVAAADGNGAKDVKAKGSSGSSEKPGEKSGEKSGERSGERSREKSGERSREKSGESPAAKNGSSSGSSSGNGSSAGDRRKPGDAKPSQPASAGSSSS